MAAFYQKYRPKTFSEVVGEDHISKTLLEAVKSDRLSHAYLLCGPRGTGKTSTARLLAKVFNCEALGSKGNSGEPCNNCSFCKEISDGRAVDVIEIDAASHTKVDEIREVIDNARYAPAKNKKKIYIIDEVHMLSNSSFNALLKTLEEPPPHAVFILATTEPHKLPATILSRTQRYDFHRVSKESIVKNLKKIAKAEKIDIDDDALDLIAVSAEGGHRDAIGMLEQVSNYSNKITRSEVMHILGIAETNTLASFIGAIFNNNPEEGLKIAHKLYESGVEMAEFNKQIIEYLRKILLFKMSGQFLFEDTKENLEGIKKIAEKTEQSKIILLMETLIKNAAYFSVASTPLLPIEMSVVEVAENQDDKSNRIEQELKEKDDKDAIIEEKKPQKDKNSEKDAEPSGKEEKSTIAVFQMTDDLWRKIIETAKKGNPSLAALLRDAKPLEVKKGTVVLGVRFPFHKDKISEGKNIKYLEGVFGDVVGGKCQVSCELLKKGNPKENQKQSSDEELQKAAEEIFG